MMLHIHELNELLSTPRKIVITTHTNPDGDAIGSSLGLYHYLDTMGHKISVLTPTAMPDFLGWMPGANRIMVYEERSIQCIAAIREAQLIFCLDFNQLNRIEGMEKHVRDSKAPKVMIDHHLFPEDFARYVLSVTSASSTAELVYDFIALRNDLENASLDCLNCLYAAILSDTGGFIHATSPKLFRTVADMNARGVDNFDLHDRVFNSYTTKRMKLLGFCLNERMEILEDCGAGIIAVSHEDHVNLDIKRGDMEGVVNYVLKIMGIKVAVLVSERTKEVKLSLRSKGTFSVQEICSQYFNGGGHKNASGATSHLPFQETIDLLKTILAERKEDIKKS